MALQRPMASILRAEARLLAIAGFQLLAISFPFTLVMVAQALAGDVSPILPIAAGVPPILMGYLPCHLAALCMAKAKQLEPIVA